MLMIAGAFSYVIAAVVAYLLGSVSISVLLTKLFYHTDVRSQGSGNAGATNVARVFGMGAGVITLLGDAAKTVLAMLLGSWLGGQTGQAVAGIACLIGHCWPIYFHFRGGKGVSVGAAVGAMIDWRLFLVLVVVFFLVFALCRIVSVCSMSCAIALPIVSVLLGVDPPQMILAAITGILVLFMHRGNLLRLIRGTEPKFKPGSRKKQGP